MKCKKGRRKRKETKRKEGKREEGKGKKRKEKKEKEGDVETGRREGKREKRENQLIKDKRKEGKEKTKRGEWKTKERYIEIWIERKKDKDKIKKKNRWKRTKEWKEKKGEENNLLKKKRTLGRIWFFEWKQVKKFENQWPRRVMFKALNRRIGLREFELQSRYHVHFRTNNFRKRGMTPIYPPIFDFYSTNTVLIKMNGIGNK